MGFLAACLLGLAKVVEWTVRGVIAVIEGIRDEGQR